MSRQVLSVSAAVLCGAGCAALLIPLTRCIVRSGDEPAPPRYEVAPVCESAVLLDTLRGDTWILDNSRAEKDPVWVPLPMIANNESTFHGASMTDTKGSPSSPRNSLRSVLERQGYTRVVVRRIIPGYLRVAAKIGDVEASLLVDTGAPGTQLDPKRMELLDGNWRANRTVRAAADSVAPDTGHVVTSVDIAGFRTREVLIKNCDVSEINKRLADHYGMAPVDGILGSDILEAHLAILNYGTCELYLMGRTTEK